jgi:hypothetical protein
MKFEYLVTGLWPRQYLTVADAQNQMDNDIKASVSHIFIQTNKLNQIIKNFSFNKQSTLLDILYFWAQ